MDGIIDSVDRHGMRRMGIEQGKGASATVWQVEMPKALRRWLCDICPCLSGRCRTGTTKALLFQHEELCEPGTVHYVLLGASLSTDKDAFELQHGDVIRASSQEDGLQLSNLFEDEVVRQSCNC
jgi:hypothetical protein